MLTTELATAIRLAAEDCRALSLPHAESRILESLLESLGTNHVRDFLWKASAKIHSVTKPEASLSDEEMHDLRKCLKDLSYDHKYIDHQTVPVLPPALTAGKEKIEPVLLLLGRFQDYCSGLQLLQEGGSLPEDKPLAGLFRHWLKEKERLRHQFRATYLPIFQRLFVAERQG